MDSRISGDLVDALCATDGLNDFFEQVLPRVARVFGSSRAILIDYYESTDHFDLLHFVGYPQQARFDLQRRISHSELRRAVSQKEPFTSEGNQARLYLPLYFVTTLEAVLLFESDSPIQLTPERLQAAAVISKFLGLLMSSSRLKINQAASLNLDDLQRARQIQLTYLPSENLQTDRYEVYGYNRSSSLVGGDYFDYFRTREHSIQCVLADASGHGLSAALIMSMFRGLLHAGISECSNCSDLFTMLNRTVHSGASVVHYLTGVFLDFDERHSRLTYTNAGHFDPALIRQDGIVERLSGGGPPLGMFRNSEYPAAETEVRAGDLLVLFTDGLTDLQDADDQYFGEARILHAIQKRRALPLKEIAASLLQESMAFSASPHPEDDLTLFMMRFH